jgi:hypothetical protein
LTAQLHKLQLEGGNFELAQVGMLTIGSGALLFGIQGLCKQADEETCIAKNEMDPPSINFIFEPVTSFVAKTVYL